MSATALIRERPSVEELRARVGQMQAGVPRLPLPMLPALAELVQMRTGGSYRVDDLALAMALVATPSAAGGWTGIVGVDDFGAEAAQDSGLNLERTVLVPDPGEDWLEVTAALVDVLPVVLLRPPAQVAGRVPARTASRLAARQRRRSTVLLVQGEWPGCEARLETTRRHWYGVTTGHGRLTSRVVEVRCRRGGAPALARELWLPDPDGTIRAVREGIGQKIGQGSSELAAEVS